MTPIAFFVPGTPVAKARARHARIGAHVRTYTPAPTVNYEAAVRFAAHEAMAGRDPITEPVHLSLSIYVTPPKSWSGRRQQQACSGEIRATKKPDASNVLKSIEDACNGIVFADDAQIVEIALSKQYARTAGVRVIVSKAGGQRAP